MSLLGREYLSVPVPDDPRDLDAVAPPAGARTPTGLGRPRRPESLVGGEARLADRPRM